MFHTATFHFNFNVTEYFKLLILIVIFTFVYKQKNKTSFSIKGLVLDFISTTKANALFYKQAFLLKYVRRFWNLFIITELY